MGSPLRNAHCACQSGGSMASPNLGLHGIIPIVYTPFDAAGRIDEEDLARLVDYLVAAGVHGLAAVGGASECHKLTLAERMRRAELTSAAARGRVPVIVGTSATNTTESVELSHHAEGIGAQAIFLTPPLFGAATPAALEYHYGAVAHAVTMPIMVQDAQVSVPPPVVAQLARRVPAIQ